MIRIFSRLAVAAGLALLGPTFLVGWACQPSALAMELVPLRLTGMEPGRKLANVDGGNSPQNASPPVHRRYLRRAGARLVLESEVTEERRAGEWKYQSITHRPAEEMKLVLSFDRDQHLQAAQLEHTTRGGKKSAAARFAGKAVVVTRDGAEMKKLIFDKEPVLATTAPDWTDIFLLVRKYSLNAGGKQEYAGLWFHPSQPARQMTFTINRVGGDTITIKGQKQELHRYLITLRSGAYLAWADGNGMAVKLMPPNRPQGAVVLEGFEEATRELK
jgi:hypothetical protein